MPLINDDYFLTLAINLSNFSSMISTIFWGFLGDQKGFSFTFLLIIMLDTLFKVFFCFAQDKYSILIAFILIGLTKKAFVILFGPALIHSLGLASAT